MTEHLTALARVQAAQARFDRIADCFTQMTALQAQWRELQADCRWLENYYHSNWITDMEADNATPFGIPCGVLSEDAIYNLLNDERQLALDWISLSVEALKGESDG